MSNPYAFEFYTLTLEGVGKYDTSGAAMRGIPENQRHRPWVIVMSQGVDHARVSIIKKRGEPLPEADK